MSRISQFLFIAWLFFNAGSAAAVTFENCGARIDLPEVFAIRLVELPGSACIGELNFSSSLAPDILRDENRIEISSQALKDALESSRYLDISGGRYRIRSPHAIDEPQYQIKTQATKLKVLDKESMKGVFLIETVLVRASPYMLWPEKTERAPAIRKFMRKNGMTFSCVYGHLGNSQAPRSITVSACIPDSNAPADPSASKLVRALENTVFLR